MSGQAEVAESGGKLSLVLDLAPSEHSFGAQKIEVESIMASAQIAG